MASELVYLVQGGPYCKIGRTTNLNGRVDALQTGHPHRLVVLRTWTVSDAAAVENFLHQTFAAVRMAGEWFDLSQAEIDALMVVEEWPVEPRLSPEPGASDVASVKRHITFTPLVATLLQVYCAATDMTYSDFLNEVLMHLLAPTEPAWLTERIAQVDATRAAITAIRERQMRLDLPST